MNNRNKSILITGILVLIGAIIAFVVGGWLAGWDFIAFFKSHLFIWICVLVGVYLIVTGSILVKSWVDNRL